MKEMFAARAAASSWRELPVQGRIRHIRSVRQLLVRDLDEWIALLGQEAGKTPMDALTTDLLTVIQAISYYEKIRRSCCVPAVFAHRSGSQAPPRILHTSLAAWRPLLHRGISRFN